MTLSIAVVLAMSHLRCWIAAFALACTLPAAAQSLPAEPGPLPALNAEQSSVLGQAMAAERVDVDARVRGGLLAPADAERLLRWREWQIARQLAGQAPASAIVERENEADRVVRVAPAPRYAYPAPVYAAPPYPAPLYPAPWYAAPPLFRPYGFIGGVCVGAGGHHGFGSLCF